MDIKRNLRLKLADSDGNKYNLNISDPSENVSKAQTDLVGSDIVDNGLVMGKAGPLKSYSGATMITTTEKEIWLWRN